MYLQLTTNHNHKWAENVIDTHHQLKKSKLHYNLWGFIQECHKMTQQQT